MFCDKCNSLMKAENGEWICKKCGFSRKVNTDDRQVITAKRQEKEIVILGADVGTLPTLQVRCRKCKNNKAFWRLEQTRSADEPETRIFKCTKCNHTWREY